MIYFAQATGGGPIKIGCTDNLHLRLARLRSSHRADLVVLGVIDGRFAKERALHVQFRHLGLGNEWFRASPDLLAFVGAETRPWTGRPEGDGALLAANLARLGYAEHRVKITEVSRLVSENTGRKLSASYLSNVLNMVRPSWSVLELLAKGLGVSVKELTKSTKK